MMKTVSKFEQHYRLKIFLTLLTDYAEKRKNSDIQLQALIKDSEFDLASVDINFGNKQFMDDFISLLRNQLRILSNELFAYPCNKNFFDLKKIDGTSDIRFCDDCKKKVYLASSEEEINQRRVLGQCISYVSKEKKIRPFGDSLTTGLLVPKNGEE